MDIEINTGKYVRSTSEYIDRLSDQISKRLRKFEQRITHVSVFLSDDNGPKGGGKDKHCSIEARVAGENPEAVTSKGDTLQEAFDDASSKIERRIATTIERRRSY